VTVSQPPILSSQQRMATSAGIRDAYVHPIWF
jgi:hypothetical protein